MKTAAILKIDSLNYSYGNTQVLKNLSMDIPSDQMIGLLGANSSGKTTLMRICAGLIRNYKGTVKASVSEKACNLNEIVCYLPSNPFYEDSRTISKTLNEYAGFFPGYRKAQAEELLKKFSLDKSLRFSQLSKGRKALVMFILYLSRNAALYLLDEPFNGVDIKTREDMKKVLLETVSPGHTFMISTHEISNMESLFDRILLLQDGRILLDEDADELRTRNNRSLTDIVMEVI